MKKIKTLGQKSLLLRTFATISAIAMCVVLASCGESSNNKNNLIDENAQKAGMQLMEGISASGELGKKPKITLKTPVKVNQNTYAVLQRGNGEAIEEGDRVCSQGIVFDSKTGKELMNTWEKGKVD
ncbi:peptidylprolyl isomerase, partial [Bifidobacteriaceae bacterium NR015]